MRINKLTTIILSTCLSVSAFSANASNSLVEQLIVDKNKPKIESATGKEEISKVDITMVKGAERTSILKRIMGDSYREDFEVAVSMGTDINSDYYNSLAIQSYNSTAASQNEEELVPNDPFFLKYQYRNFETIEWLKSFASPNSLTPLSDNSYLAPAVVGVIDGEYSGNNDINIVDGKGFYRKAEGLGFVMVHDDYDNGSKSVCDELGSNYHGLGVTSISSSLPDNGIGLTGYGNADVVYAKALECGIGFSDDIARAMYWMSGADVSEIGSLRVNDKMVASWKKREPVDVINLSLGGGFECDVNSPYQAAIDYANGNNIPVVVAAGNENNDGVASPAICDGTIGVVALESDGNKAGYSNYGNGADIAVIGSGVATYGIPTIAYEEGDDISDLITNEKRFMSGTSMATPIVSAVVAQMRQVDPSITPDRILEIIKETADPFPTDSDCNETYYCGAGILNAERAVQVAGQREIDAIAIAVPALNGYDICNKKVMTLNSNALAKICQVHDVNFFGLRYLSRAYEDTVYNVYQVDLGADVSDTDTPMATTRSPSMKLRDLDSANYDYIIEACDGDLCEDSIQAKIKFKAHIKSICD